MIRKDSQQTSSRLAAALLGVSLGAASIAGCTGMEGARTTDVAMAGGLPMAGSSLAPAWQTIDYAADEPYGSGQQ